MPIEQDSSTKTGRKSGSQVENGRGSCDLPSYRKINRSRGAISWWVCNGFAIRDSATLLSKILTYSKRNLVFRRNHPTASALESHRCSPLLQSFHSLGAPQLQGLAVECSATFKAMHSPTGYATTSSSLGSDISRCVGKFRLLKSVFSRVPICNLPHTQSTGTQATRLRTWHLRLRFNE